MKQLFLILILFCVSIPIIAQEEDAPKIKDKKPKNEVRLITENFLEKNEVLSNYQVWSSTNFSNTGTYEYYNNKFRYGLGYNYNLNKIGFRSRLFYADYVDTYFDYNKTKTESNGKTLRVSFGLNYQKHFKKITLYIGLDYSYFQIDLEQTMDNPELWGTNNIIYQSTNYKGNGIEPLIGFKYFFTNHFSVSSEIRFIADKFEGESSVTYYNYINSNNDNYDSTFDGSYSNLGPKGSISLNVHF